MRCDEERRRYRRKDAAARTVAALSVSAPHTLLSLFRHCRYWRAPRCFLLMPRFSFCWLYDYFSWCCWCCCCRDTYSPLYAADASFADACLMPCRCQMRVATPAIFSILLERIALSFTPLRYWYFLRYFPHCLITSFISCDTRCLLMLILRWCRWCHAAMMPGFFAGCFLPPWRCRADGHDAFRLLRWFHFSPLFYWCHFFFFHLLILLMLSLRLFADIDAMIWWWCQASIASVTPPSLCLFLFDTLLSMPRHFAFADIFFSIAADAPLFRHVYAMPRHAAAIFHIHAAPLRLLRHDDAMPLPERCCRRITDISLITRLLDLRHRWCFSPPASMPRHYFHLLLLLLSLLCFTASLLIDLACRFRWCRLTPDAYLFRCQLIFSYFYIFIFIFCRYFLLSPLYWYFLMLDAIFAFIAVSSLFFISSFDNTRHFMPLMPFSAIFIDIIFISDAWLPFLLSLIFSPFLFWYRRFRHWCLCFSLFITLIITPIIIRFSIYIIAMPLFFIFLLITFCFASFSSFSLYFLSAVSSDDFWFS